MKKTKINSTFLTAAKSLFVLLLLASCAGNTESKRPLGGETSELTQQEMIKRGKYLTTIAGCNDCHSPKIMTPHGL
jgi:hypothetical protein